MLALREFDVIIAGAGLAGLTLALQLRQRCPKLSLAVVDRLTRPLPEAAHKVGESSVEVGSRYLEQLGLGEYLVERQIIKFGLRFFPGGGQLPIDQRTEIGPSQEPPVRSYQLDRGRFENDLRELLGERDVELLEGWTLREVVLCDSDEPSDEGRHELRLQRGTEELKLRARWFIDATGRGAFLRRRLKLEESTAHSASACWFRASGRLDITRFVPDSEPHSTWHDHPLAERRWRSTNHFMGKGYWVWFIPLASGNTSIGIVAHDEYHGFDKLRTLERAQAFLRQHEPFLAEQVDSADILDFRCLHGYSHNAERCWSKNRWGLVGEAGAFVDPLYSPGTDFIAFANSFTAELIAREVDGEDIASCVETFNHRYHALVSNAVDLFRLAGPVYAHPRAMGAKIYWDNFSYWSFMAQYFFQGIYRLEGPVHDEIIACGLRFAELSNHLQLLFHHWAELAPEDPTPGFIGVPRFPSLLVDAYLDLQKKLSPAETLELLRLRLEQGEEMAAELVLRTLASVSPEISAQLMDRCKIAAWDLRWAPERVAAEEAAGIKRRHALSPVVRDVERSLGRLQKHERYQESWGRLGCS